MAAKVGANGFFECTGTMTMDNKQGTAIGEQTAIEKTIEVIDGLINTLTTQIDSGFLGPNDSTTTPLRALSRWRARN